MSPTSAEPKPLSGLGSPRDAIQAQSVRVGDCALPNPDQESRNLHNLRGADRRGKPQPWWQRRDTRAGARGLRHPSGCAHRPLRGRAEQSLGGTGVLAGVDGEAQSRDHGRTLLRVRSVLPDQGPLRIVRSWVVIGELQWPPSLDSSSQLSLCARVRGEKVSRKVGVLACVRERQRQCTRHVSSETRTLTDTTLTPPGTQHGATRSNAGKGNPSEYAAFATPCTSVHRLSDHS